MDLQLSRHVAVVTGASKGIGLAITRTLLDEGARVVAASRKVTPELDALTGSRLVHMPVDLMDPEAPAAVISRAVEEFGGLDILVNNAGGPPPGAQLPRFSFHALTDVDWRAIFAAAVGADREAVLGTVAPQMMALATGRLAEPQEIADVVALLASPRSGSTTGAEFTVDGGFLKEI
jgi:NAD(P)-dependent dehydrogenase (short-subunit alcohol dehydrogenase family)